jgi:hypothetical protein
MPDLSRLVSALALVGLVACGGNAVDNGEGSGGGNGGAAVNGCDTFVDQTAVGAARKIEWGLPVATSPNRCMMIKRDQTVAFEGDFTVHPLGASGGDAPNPFAAVPDTGKVTFAAAGTFGFVCGVHASMTGAIKVVE